MQTQIVEALSYVNEKVLIRQFIYLQGMLLVSFTNNRVPTEIHMSQYCGITYKIVCIYLNFK